MFPKPVWSGIEVLTSDPYIFLATWMAELGWGDEVHSLPSLKCNRYCRIMHLLIVEARKTYPNSPSTPYFSPLLNNTKLGLS
mgnify:CR=1 FL=1